MPSLLRKPLVFLLFLFQGSRLLSNAVLAVELTGEELYSTQCAGCHGPMGQGTKLYRPRLEGALSTAQLAELIQKTMPKDEPGSLSKEESQAVATYIHESFYSPIARERARPPRQELSRLTVKQYRQALSDLVGSFRWNSPWGKERGLAAEYFKGRRFNNENRVVKRIDSQVRFEFGTEAPVPEITEPHEFSIRWNGALRAPETGEYEIVAQTEHAVRVWVNDNQQPLIDAWVKSGNETEYKSTIFLVAGRIYPLRMEFSKAKQGVDDSKDQKKKPPSAPASIKLLWRIPNRVPEPIPSRCLSTNSGPEVYVCATPFPPDDRSYGWERGTAVNREWDQATTAGALELTAYLSRRVNDLAGTKEDAGDRVEKLKEWSRKFVERALRRPLTPEQQALFIDKQFAQAANPDLAIKRVVLLTLKSPHFLYREVDGKGDAYDVAARLSFGLWDSLPDQELMSAAAGNRLSNPDQIRQQARRMLADPRGEAKLREFLLNWLRVNSGTDLAKDSSRFPGYDASAISDLRTSLEMALEDVLTSEEADFRQLFLNEGMYLNERLAKLYGAEVPNTAEFAKVPFETDKRRGMLTHPYVMAMLAHSAESSPIHRGVFLMRGILGHALRAPPEAVAPLPADLHPNLTTRERVTLQTSPAFCTSCHATINPLGFTLEHFDAIGRYRTEDHQKPVDSSASYVTRNGQTVNFQDATQLVQFLADSEEAQQAFTEQLFHFLVQQSIGAYGPEKRQALTQIFREQKFNIRQLALEIMVASVFTNRETVKVTSNSTP